MGDTKLIGCLSNFLTVDMNSYRRNRLYAPVTAATAAAAAVAYMLISSMLLFCMFVK